MSLRKTLHSLHHFCKEGNYEKVKQILEEQGEAVLEKKRYHHADSPLLAAADAGNADIVRLLLSHGADVNSCDNWGETALHLVAAKDHTDCAKVLLSAPSIDIGLRSKVHQLTPYQKAKQYKSISVKKLLKSAEIRKLVREAKDREQISKLLKELEISVSTDDVTSECCGEALLSAVAVGNEEAALGILHFSAIYAQTTLDLQACLTTALERKLLKLATIVFICILVHYKLVQELSGVLGDFGAVEQNCEFLQCALKKVDLSLDKATVNKIRDNVSTIKCSDLAAPILFAMHNPEQENAAKHLLWHNCLGCSDSIQWKNLSLPRLKQSWFHELYQLPEGKPFYSRICKLDLRKNRLKNVPDVVFQLPLINVIYLDSNELTKLPGGFSWSRSLRSLYLSNNQLRELPETMATAHLTTLKVNHNRLGGVPKCICELVWLESLDLSGNPGITNLPEEMGRLTNLKHFVFDKDKIISPFGWQSHTQSAQDLVRWLQALLRSSKKFTQVKLMVTGWQAKGKTTLIHRLNDDFRFNENSATTGIQISDLKESKSWWPSLSLPDHRPSFQVWDFAGHEDFYVTHMCFLSAIALYLLVWNLCDGEQGIKDLSSWLNNISARTGHSSHKSVVIIVGTHLDVVTKYEEHYGQAYVERMRLFIKTLLKERNDEHLAVVDIVEVSSCSDRPRGIDNLKNKIYSAVKVMMKNSGDGEKQVKLVDELVPHAFIVLAKRIQEMRSEKLENNLPPILTRPQLRAEVSHAIRSDPSDKGRPNDPNDFQQAAQFLEERGFVLHFNDSSGLLRDLYFIDPRWLCDLMSHIITVPFTSQRKKAILNKSDLQELMQRNGFPRNYNQQYVQLLNRFQVAYSLTEDDMLVPSQLPDEKPTEVFNEENQRCYTPIQRIYSISQMPHGLFSRLLVILLSNLSGILEGSSSVEVKAPSVFDLLNKHLFCWRSGIFFRDVSLVFAVTSLPGSEASSAKVRIQVSPDKGGQKALSVIIDHIEALINEWFAGIKKRRVVRTVPCHACEKSGHDAHAFKLEEYEHDDAQGEHYKCRKQNISLPLHHVAPDLAFHDIEEEYLLHEKHLKLDQDELMRIGKGDFGTVYRGECRDRPAAIKVFNGENPYREVRKELAVLRRVVSHPNLVSMLGVGRRPLCIAMELADRGSLDRTLFSEPPVAIPRIVLVAIGREIAEALYFLHSLGIVHRDLKPANVLLYSLVETDRVHVKLSDFGTTGFITPGGLKSMVGPTAICAPEMLEFSSVGEYGPQVDVYSFAIFLYNLVTRRNAFHMLPDSGRIKESVLKKRRPPWKDAGKAIYHLTNLTQLMCHCWNHAPFDRPTAAQVRDQLSQPFFQLLMGKVCFAEQRALLQATFLPVNRDIWFLYCTTARCVASIFSTDKMTFKRHTSVTDHSLSNILFACSTVDSVVIFIQNSKGGITLKLCSIATHEVVKEDSFSLPFKSLNGVAVCGSFLYLASSEGLYVASVDNLIPDREQGIRKYRSEECLAVVVVSKEVWVTARDSIYVFLAKQNDLGLAASINVRETNETTRFGSTKLDVSPNGQHVWFLRYSILTKYDAMTKTELLTVNCLDLLRSATNQFTQDYVTCFSPAHDTLWLGTRSGMVLILSANTGNLLAWNRPYETEVTGLILCAGAQPSTIVSLGNRLRREGLSPGDCVTCSLALEEAEVIDNDKQRRVSNGSGSQKRKLRGCLKDSSWTEATASFHGVALVWEALSTERLSRIL